MLLRSQLNGYDSIVVSSIGLTQADSQPPDLRRGPSLLSLSIDVTPGSSTPCVTDAPCQDELANQTPPLTVLLHIFMPGPRTLMGAIGRSPQSSCFSKGFG